MLLRYIWILSARILRVTVELLICAPWRRVVGSATVARLVLKLVISWRIVVRFRPRLPYPQGIDISWVVGWVSTRPGQSARRSEKPLGPAEIRTTDRAARSPVKISNESSGSWESYEPCWCGGEVAVVYRTTWAVTTAVCHRTLYMQLVLSLNFDGSMWQAAFGSQTYRRTAVASQQRFNSFTGAFWLQALKLLGRLLTSQRSRSGQCMICRTTRLTAFCFALTLVMFRLTAPRLTQSACRLVARIRIILKWPFSYFFKVQWSLYVPHSGHYMYRSVVTICTAQWSLYVQPVVTICTAQWSLYVPHSGHYMYHQFNINQFYVLPTLCIYVFCVDLRTNNVYFTVQHWLVGFYNWDEVCLLRGTFYVLPTQCIYVFCVGLRTNNDYFTVQH